MKIGQIISMIKILKSEKKESKKEIKETKKKSIFKDLIDNPDDFKLELYTEDGEIVMKIKKNKKEDESNS